MPRIFSMLALGTLAAALPGMAQAQSYSCSVPQSVPRPHPELPGDKEPARRLAIGSYTLALTWSPQYCRGHFRDANARFQCGANRFGFTLHGLWPDGYGKEWPQYCAATGILAPATINRHLCATPSAQLLQHEWAKHGTCIPGTNPDAYFTRSNALYAKLRYPDMDALSHRPLIVGQFKAALARANPGLPASAIRVTVSKGWLDELWLCLDKSDRYERCKTGTGGLPDRARLKIWRGPR